MENARIYLKLIRISMKGRMQYRSDFLTGMASVLLLNTINLSLIGILVSRFTTIHGWSVWDLVFLYSIFTLGHSLYSLLFWQFGAMDQYISQGTFDQFLIRPISPLLQFLGREIQYMGFADIIVGVAGMTLAYVKLGLHWQSWQFGYALIAVLAGAAAEVAIRWSIASSSFWLGRSMGINMIMNRFMFIGQQYPISLFGNWFQILMTVIPFSFMNYYPSLVLLDKVRGSQWIGLLSPVVAIVAVTLAALLWRAGIRRYASTGS